MSQLLVAVAALLPLTSVAQVAGGPPSPATPQPVSLLPAPAQTGAPPSRAYLFAKAGAVFPSDDGGLGPYDNGPAVEAGAGYGLTPNFALEGGLGYFAATWRGSGTDPSLGAYEAEDTFRAVPLLASLRLSGRVGDVEFFGLLGGGVYFLTLHGETTSSLLGSTSGSDSDTALGVHVAGGVAAYVTPRMTLGVEARYLFANAELAGSESSFDSAFLTATVGYRL